MEGNPHRLLEAVLLAAYAVGAARGVLYIHGEAELSAERVAGALAQARRCGLLGDRILGSDFSLEIEIRRGLGGFVLGEETALLESIEGRRAMPRTRPPFPVEAGLWGKPTVTTTVKPPSAVPPTAPAAGAGSAGLGAGAAGFVGGRRGVAGTPAAFSGGGGVLGQATVINNVETLFAVPSIVARGGAWFAGLGGGRGTKLFGLSGHVRRPGVVEMELGSTLRTLMEDLGGGSSTGRPIRAVVLGGPSGSIVHPRHFDEPLVPRGPVNPGTGGVVVLDEGASVKDAVVTLLAFNARESCGKCTPCREGTARLVALLDDGRPDVGR